MLDITRLSLCHGAGTAHTPRPGLCTLSYQRLLRKEPSPAQCSSAARCFCIIFRKNKCLSLVPWRPSFNTSHLNTTSPGNEGTFQGSWSCQLPPRAVRGSHRGAREHGRAGAKPPGHTRVQFPHWSRQWCPCHLSGILTGIHLSGWRLQTWRIHYSCWAPGCCKKQSETGLRELWRCSSGGQVRDSGWQLLSITATTKAKGCAQTWPEAFLNMHLIIRRDLFICPNFTNAWKRCLILWWYKELDCDHRWNREKAFRGLTSAVVQL